MPSRRLNLKRPFIVIMVIACAFAWGAISFNPPRDVVAADEPVAKAVDFDRDVAPILVTHCLECHSGSKPKGGLDLSTKATAMRGQDGAVLLPGDRAKSELWRVIHEGEMPPRNPLTKPQIDTIGRWIDGGAAWGGVERLSLFTSTTSRRAGYDWWSLQPLKPQEPPKVESESGAVTPIDAFLMAKLHSLGMTYSPPADPRTLIRRVHFDLIGLPPTPEEVEAFVKEWEIESSEFKVRSSESKGDPSTGLSADSATQNSELRTRNSYAKLVDRLLASPHYGERWGRHWLDVARYGESHGFERNDPRHHAWHYRDWVVRALNDDMPYDRFTRMQIAGDALTNDSHDGQAAVGLLVAGLHNTVVGASPTMKRLAREDELEEIVGMVGQTFLGLTLNCARCHDHKFDPVSQEEYYRFTAALAGVTHGERKIKPRSDQQELDRISEELAALQQRIAALEAPARQAELAARASGQVPAAKPPTPLAQWEFNEDLHDALGDLHGKSHGEATLRDGQLILDGKQAFVSTPPVAKDITAKTLEAWVRLDSLTQRGGGVISLQSLDGSVFDAIVFGEREPGMWMAGSDFFRRTAPFQGDDESQAKDRVIHVAITYGADGMITAYREGKPYGKPYKSAGPVTFKAGQAQVVLGMRHAPTGGNKMLAGRIERARLYDRALTDQEIALSAGAADDHVAPERIIARLSPDQRELHAQFAKRRQQLGQEFNELSRRSVEQPIFTVVSTQPATTRLLHRGSVTDEGTVVEPGVTDCIAALRGAVRFRSDAGDGERRKALAQWITHRDNALFARVIVNRLWHHHFGQGLVQTPSDLGFGGGRPSHPELLDFLAQQLITHGYRLKAIHRMIVLSSAYMQSSRKSSAGAGAARIDAGNRLLWRFTPRRLDGEVVRDAMLHVAGRLDTSIGGPPFVDVSITPNNGTTYYEPIDREDPAFNRRTLYRFSPRGGRSALLDTFDCPDPSAAAPRRSVTTTPLQALSLLNDAFVLRMADHLAARVARERGAEVAAQVDRMFALVLQRAPDAEERNEAVALVRRHGLSTLARAMFNSSEFVIAE